MFSIQEYPECCTKFEEARKCVFSPDSDSYGVLTSNNNELAVHAFETGCRSRALVLAVVLVLGAVSWMCAWWRPGAGAGCWCWVL